MAMGTQGVWTGSVWLTAAESDYQPGLVDKLLKADSTQTVRSRCISGKPARMLVTPYTQAWDGPDSPGTLPMPLQYMATADATQRIFRYAESGEEGCVDLLGTPVGQVVGMMNARRAAKDIVFDFVNDYIDAIGGLSAQLEKAATEE